MRDLNIIYRLCENETDGNLRDIRPEWFNKIECLKSFIDSCTYANDHIHSLTFLHDGPKGPLYDYLINCEFEINKVEHKDNLKSLLTTFDIADELHGDIYFVEDDYVHKLDSVEKIAKAKLNQNITALQRNRFDQLMKERIEAGAKFGLDEQFIKEIFDSIHEQSIKIQTDIFEKNKK